ncbi:MAG TPA: S9 family peptidase [Nevskiaceae bacterium]|nr:S9 family peptidase [Nevskiaceae bacterium]
MLHLRPWLASLVLATAGAHGAAVTRIEQGNLVTENVPPIPATLIERTNQFQQTRGAAFQGWTADGGILITTRFAESAQVHRVAFPGGARTQQTFYPEPVQSALPARKGSGFLFSKDIGGNEFYQVYWFDPAQGRARLLTDGTSRNTEVTWSNKGDRVAFSTTRRNGRDFDLHVMALSDETSHPVLEREGAWSVLDWSPDDRRLLVQKYISINESELWIVPLEKGVESMRFRMVKERVAFADARFSRDGKGIWYVSDEGSDFRRLRYENLDGTGTRVLSQGTPWDVSDLALSDGGTYLAWVANADGFSELHVHNLVTDKEMPLPSLPKGRIGALEFDRTGKRLAFSFNGARSAGDVYSIEVSKKTLTRWTASETGGLDASKFVEPELVHFKSFDERAIPAFYYRAPQPGPRPVLIQIHGGPEAQALPTFNPVTEFLVREMGISVLYPNVRGSDGYGKTYLRLDNDRLRENSVKDIGALLDWIAKRPELDASRVAVAGGSYGGYMTLASLTHYNDRLACGVDTVGISNFVTFLTNTQDYRRDLRRVEYGDERDPQMRAFLESISPTTNAHRITKPLFVLQGANDPRVPASEAEQIVKTVRGNGGDVWYALAKDEGHGFAKKANRDFAQNTTLMFLQQCLGLGWK